MARCGRIVIAMQVLQDIKAGAVGVDYDEMANKKDHIHWPGKAKWQGQQKTLRSRSITPLSFGASWQARRAI